MSDDQTPHCVQCGPLTTPEQLRAHPVTAAQQAPPPAEKTR